MLSNICNICFNILETKTNIIREHNECRSCNLGVFSSGCTCSYTDAKYVEYWCKNCEIQLYSCRQCKNYFDKLTCNYCENCKNKIKTNNPSNEQFIYEFNDKTVNWDLKKKKCTNCLKFLEACDWSQFPNPHSYFSNDVNICIYCILEIKLGELIKEYNDVEFTIVNKNIKFRKKCICTKFTDWIDIFYLTYLCITQCDKCDPSTSLEKYKYYCNVWKIDITGKKCEQCCINILWTNGIWTSKQLDTFILQCEKCKPEAHKDRKYKFYNSGWNSGWKVEKIRVFSGKKHVWKNNHSGNKNYTCQCDRCMKK